MIIEELLNRLNDIYITKPNRLKHVLGVRDTAIKFGKIYNCNLEKLEIAALLHDITKYYTYEENIRVVNEYFSNSDYIIKEYNEHILHAYSAYVIAQVEYGITDTDILNPIMHHTIGKEAMTIYEKIIFVSDYIEPNRIYKSSIKVRKLAEENLDLAVFVAIDDSIKYYEKNGGQVPSSAYHARKYYNELLEEQNEKN
jgi:predicted HD superfamily hydrolase involved in NAD metabolism